MALITIAVAESYYRAYIHCLFTASVNFFFLPSGGWLIGNPVKQTSCYLRFWQTTDICCKDKHSELFLYLLPYYQHNRIGSITFEVIRVYFCNTYYLIFTKEIKNLLTRSLYLIKYSNYSLHYLQAEFSNSGTGSL